MPRMLAQEKPEDVEINLKLVTWNESDEHLDISKSNLEEIKDSLFDLGIHLEYEFNPNIHDRYIQANKGWKIDLGRGLDIYQKPEGSYDVSSFMQEKRKCKQCFITYNKQ